MTDDAPRAPEPEDLTAFGGETACSLHPVCPECGALEDAPRTTCGRCGHAFAGQDETR
ncbi:hypothetical protein [Myceligenerans crystallogenes]|uniref:Small CPxCG-related zinc finger protein n=1 Tax=Myceligenerans crystallogenes TaxID=316335 RepID=A0ABN2NAS5_9MICO